MLTYEGIIIIAGWLISMATALFIVPRLAAERTLKRFGLVKVENSRGEEVFAAADPDGEPIKVPVSRVGKDGKITTSEEYVGLAYSLPTIAAMQIKASFYGKVGNAKQKMEAQLLEGMDIDTAAKVQAFKLASQGKVGQAFMALLTPVIARKINETAATGVLGGQTGTQGSTDRSGGYHPGI